MEHRSAVYRMLCAAILPVAWLSSAYASTAAPTAQILSVADGPVCSVIRAAGVFQAAPGVLLRPGDLIATESGGLLILAFKAGAAVLGMAAVGPSSRLHWLERSDQVNLAVLRGWIKVDTLSAGRGLEVQVEGPHLGAGSDAGSFVLHAGGVADEVFHETGSMRLWSRSAEGVRADASSAPSQFSRRGEAGPIHSRIGPDADFVDAMPAPFRDPLPLDLAARPLESAEPARVRGVAYEDVADWLAAPRDWRRGLARRFRPRPGGDHHPP